MCQRNEGGFSLSLSNNNLDQDTGNAWNEKSVVLDVNRIRPFREETLHDLGGCLIEESTNLPTLLLRRKFERTTFVGHAARYVFCPLQDTVEAMQSGSIDFLADMKTELETATALYGFNRTALRKIREGTSYSVARSLLYRLHTCHKIMTRYQCSEPLFLHFMDADTGEDQEQEDKGKMLFRLQLFMDTHLDICEYIRRTDAYTDELLTNPDYNKDDLVKSVLEQYLPSDYKVAYCGSLPDLIPCIDMGNVWYDVRPKPRIEMVTCALIHIMACKTQSHKCQLRNFMRILRGYFRVYPCMIALYRMLLEVSFMGNYPHATCRPSFDTRMDIRASFRSDNLTEDLLFLWMDENCQLVYYATKEFYMYMVESQYTLDRMMAETNCWEDIKRTIVDAMDIARRSISMDDGISQQCFADIEKDMKQMHQDTLPYISKLRKAPFVEMILQEMNKVHEKIAVNKKSTAVQTSEMALANYDPDPGKANAFRTFRDMQFVVDERFSSRNENENELELRWLKCFEISEEGYKDIQRLYFDYERKDIADNAIGRRLTQIYEHRAYDFHLIRVFFRMVNEKKTLAEYNLSSDYAENQMRALRAKYCVPPWDVLSENADVFYYCTVCNRWLTPVIDPASKKSKLNVYAQGFEKALYDHSTDTIYCGKQNTSINVRKMMNSGIYYTEGEIEDEKMARTIRKHKETVRCCDTPLECIHMIGKIKKLGGKLWALCEICGGMTQWEGAKFSHLGFTCERHFEKPVQPNPSLVVNEENEKLRLVLKKICEGNEEEDGQILLDYNEQKEDDLMQRRKDWLIENRRKHPQTYCYYCWRSVPPSATKVKILEDDDHTYTYLTVPLCDTDFERCKWIFKDNKIVEKRFVFKAITKTSRREDMKTHIKKPTKHPHNDV